MVSLPSSPIASRSYSCSAPLLALSTACAALQSGRPDAMASLRRIARRLREGAAQAGLEQVAAAAATLQGAADPEQALLLARDLEDRLRTQGRTASQSSIVMVEDDKVTARITAELLEADGHQVLWTPSLAGARDLLRDGTADLVLLDVVLPGEDGRDLLSELRSNPAMHGVPIIAWTSRDDVITQAECFALGADAFLIKPVHPDVLRSSVAAALDLAIARRAEGRIDRLTGLPNRAAFMDALERSSALSQQGGRPLSVAMLDIDHFKSINDNWGHGVGDDVLRALAKTVSGALRVSDMIARWGGEEFCVLLPDTDPAGGAIAIQKALAAVRDLVFQSEDKSTTFSVTFSAGVAPVVAGRPGPHAIEAADALLYEAKASGRNCVLTAASANAPLRLHAIVADDDPEVRAMLAGALERQGYAVSQCADGVEAVALARQTNVALAVLDLDMPNLNGFETLQALRATPLLARLPILILTGSHEEADLVKGFDLGVSDYMTKPLRISELIARVRRLMNRR